MNGCLISLEGGEGAGKSTVLAGLRSHIETRGIVLHVTREPGGTALGEAIRRLVLDGSMRDVCAESELLLMFAARAQLVRELIQPALTRGDWVLTDRFTDASFAYQGGGRGQPQTRIAELERWAADGLRPDLTLLLTYRTRAEHEPERFRIIDSSRDLTEVRDAACAAVDQFIAARRSSL